MALNPYYENQTVFGQLKKGIIAIWPTMYRLLNGLIEILVSAAVSMVRAAMNAFKM